MGIASLNFWCHIAKTLSFIETVISTQNLSVGRYEVGITTKILLLASRIYTFQFVFRKTCGYSAIFFLLNKRENHNLPFFWIFLKAVFHFYCITVLDFCTMCLYLRPLMFDYRSALGLWCMDMSLSRNSVKSWRISWKCTTSHQ